ncbi:hypothetical protein AAES_30973 [Amazona aestiva]|uniref:VWF/SSPO/Zonadhesin-like cysteine-rich domain-containing protein n=1 Tax=Amazona aestiva TaxID=12930 RepID=A0A0Q3PSN8_AMAAE|nr:hypothetical protein AAES_30973 [Amazona aestiva]
MVESTPRCVHAPQPPLVCHILGRWRYRAFDGKTHALSPACTQALVSTCSAQLASLEVTAGGQVGRGPGATFNHVSIRGDGFEVVLLRGEETMAREDKWKAGREQRECQDVMRCGKKEEEEEEEECRAMVRKEGPFRRCHGLVHPGTYYRDCVADGCHPGGKCRVLAAYAAACRNAGIKALEWRGKDLCRE